MYKANKPGDIELKVTKGSTAYDAGLLRAAARPTRVPVQILLKNCRW